jgi:phage terminase large subunit
MSNPVIAETNSLEFRGAAAELFKTKAHEVILSGPYETGKTFAWLVKMNALCAKYGNCHNLMIRGTYKSLISSAVVTFMQKIHGGRIGESNYPVKAYGGSRPEMFIYPNGTKLLLGGMDNADKFLSAEFDFIGVTQAEEISLDSWEKLIGRATGRAGNAPYSQIMADCNPDAPKHWIPNRKSLNLLHSVHEDNPRLYNADGSITTHGRKSMSILDSLTGLRYKRGRLGLWVGAEGQIYEFIPEIHLLPNNFKIPKSWRRIRSIDFGYRNAFVCQWYALDNDDRMYLYREIYMSGRIVEDHAKLINKLSKYENIAATVADHDAEDAATLARYGIDTIPAYKAVKRGIEAVETRIRKYQDGKPRLFVLSDCTVEIDRHMEMQFKPTSTQDEFSSYVWDSRGKEQPSKEDDHGMDALRYAVALVDGLANDSVSDEQVSYDVMDYEVISGW